MNRTYTPPPKLRDREPGTITPLQGVVYARIGADVAAVPKECAVEHEGYRRLVAKLPCKHCGIAGLSQAAHPNTGKGMGIKTDDRECFPLCCDTPGRPGCHPKFDQGALFTKSVRREIEKAWSADTRRAIEAAGEWPEKLERLT